MARKEERNEDNSKDIDPNLLNANPPNNNQGVAISCAQPSATAGAAKVDDALPAPALEKGGEQAAKDSTSRFKGRDDDVQGFFTYADEGKDASGCGNGGYQSRMCSRADSSDASGGRQSNEGCDGSLDEPRDLDEGGRGSAWLEGAKCAARPHKSKIAGGEGVHCDAIERKCSASKSDGSRLETSGSRSASPALPSSTSTTPPLSDSESAIATDNCEQVQAQADVEAQGRDRYSSGCAELSVTEDFQPNPDSDDSCDDVSEDAHPRKISTSDGARRSEFSLSRAHVEMRGGEVCGWTGNCSSTFPSASATPSPTLVPSAIVEGESERRQAKLNSFGSPRLSNRITEEMRIANSREHPFDVDKSSRATHPTFPEFRRTLGHVHGAGWRRNERPGDETGLKRPRSESMRCELAPSIRGDAYWSDSRRQVSRKDHLSRRDDPMRNERHHVRYEESRRRMTQEDDHRSDPSQRDNSYPRDSQSFPPFHPQLHRHPPRHADSPTGRSDPSRSDNSYPCDSRSFPPLHPQLHRHPPRRADSPSGRVCLSNEFLASLKRRSQRHHPTDEAARPTSARELEREPRRRRSPLRRPHSANLRSQAEREGGVVLQSARDEWRNDGTRNEGWQRTEHLNGSRGQEGSSQPQKEGSLRGPPSRFFEARTPRPYLHSRSYIYAEDSRRRLPSPTGYEHEEGEGRRLSRREEREEEDEMEGGEAKRSRENEGRH